MIESETSPFIFDAPVPPEDLVGRDQELAALRDRAHHGRFVLLYGPRRYGKTSLVHRLAAEAAETRDLAVVVADLEGVLTLDDIARRIESAYRLLPEGRVRKAVTRAAAGLVDLGVQIALGSVGLSATARRRDPQEATMVLERLLELPFEVGRGLGLRVLVVMDEFQAIGAVPNADAVLRSKIQHQREHVSYVFAGSEQGLLQAIFADRARPLYGQAEHLVLEPLKADALADLVGRKFDETGRDPGMALGPLLALGAGHPQRVALLAHHLWYVVGPGGTGDAADWLEAKARAVRAATPEFAAVWTGLSDGQRRVLRLVAHGEPLYGAAARRLSLAKSSATRAATALVDRSLVTAAPARLIDPLLGEWVRTTQPAP
jgi:hypothetical protein